MQSRSNPFDYLLETISFDGKNYCYYNVQKLKPKSYSEYYNYL